MRSIAANFKLALVLLLVSVSLAAGELKSLARETAEKKGNAIITVRAVINIKQSFGGQTHDRENKVEVPAVIIDPTGLTVTAASLIDPTAATARMNPGGEQRMDAEIKEATLLLADGTEVPAQVVMKDTDLNLVFIAPKEAGKTFEAVELKPRGTPVQALEDVYVVTRLNKLGNRSIAFNFGMVKSVVKAPRPFFVCDEGIAPQTGCLVFGADGNPVGLAVVKFSSESLRNSRESFLYTVCAIEDVIEIATQAKAAKK